MEKMGVSSGDCLTDRESSFISYSFQENTKRHFFIFILFSQGLPTIFPGGVAFALVEPKEPLRVRENKSGGFKADPVLLFVLCVLSFVLDDSAIFHDVI
jgi:hypothetical protein